MRKHDLIHTTVIFPEIIRCKGVLKGWPPQTRSMALKKWMLILSLCNGLLSTSPASAQQTIFNVPSADVTPKGSIFLQHESQFRLWKPGKFWVGTHYAAVGIGYNTDLDATLFNVSSPRSDNIALGLGFKSFFPLLANDFPEREFKLTVGGMVPISLQGKGAGGWGYSHLSGRLPHLNTRLTAGISGGTEILFGRDVVTFIGGFEQPITKDLTLIADWYSGRNALGFFIPGFSYAFSQNITGYFGFQIPNRSQNGRSGFVFEIATIF